MASLKMRKRIARAGIRISMASTAFRRSLVSPRPLLSHDSSNFSLLAIQIPHR